MVSVGLRVGLGSVCTQDGLFALSRTQSERAATFFTEMENFGRDIVDFIVSAVNNEQAVTAGFANLPFPPRTLDPNPNRISEVLIPDWGRTMERDLACLNVRSVGARLRVSFGSSEFRVSFGLLVCVDRRPASTCGRSRSRRLPAASGPALLTVI